MSMVEKAKRYLVFLFGLFISSLGVSMITKADLGTSPISAIPYVLSLNFPWTLGGFTVVFSLVLILLQLIILRKNFKLEHLLQIPISMAFGWFIDLTMVWLSFLVPQSYPLKLASLLAGCVVLAFGVYLEVLANVAMLPGESFVRAVVMTWKTEFGTTKVCFDVSITVIAVVVSFVLSGKLAGVREGTIIAALVVGFIARIFGRVLHFLPGVLFGVQEKAESQEIREGGSGFVVAIGREYGSGGREIGRKLAEQLGYDFYDDEIIRRAAGTTGYSTKFIEQQEESMTSSVLYDLLTQMYTYAPAQESPKDEVFSAERSIILDVARKGNCVIVGRCSDWILRDDPHCLRVWLQASEQARIARIMEYDHCDAAGARAIMAKGDAKRASYYQYYTRHVWGLARNFHIAVDTTLGYDYARETIAGALKTLQNNLAAKA